MRLKRATVGVVAWLALVVGSLATVAGFLIGTYTHQGDSIFASALIAIAQGLIPLASFWLGVFAVVHHQRRASLGRVAGLALAALALAVLWWPAMNLMALG